MAKQITKEQFEALPDILKTSFTPDGNNYSLVEEDVEGLKKSKAEILAEKKALQTEMETLKAFKSEFEKKQTTEEEERLKAAGEFKALEEKLRAKIAETEAEKESKLNGILGTLKQERLTNELIKRGVLADRAKYALADIANEVDLVSDEQGFSLKVKSGIGDAKEFDVLIEQVKQKSPFFFAANNSTGSGATGSEGNKSGTGRAWSTLTIAEKTEAIRNANGDAEAAMKQFQ